MATDTDEEILARSQALLLTRREAMTTGGIPAPLAVAASRGAPIDPRVVVRPTFGDRLKTSLELDAEANRKLVREIPHRFGWARWGSPLLLAARVHLATSTLTEVEAALALEVGAWSRVVLVGPASSGKTSLACAHLAALTMANPRLRPRFVPARKLLAERSIGPDSVPWAALALAADPLVVDDLGAELAGAPAGSGLLAQRIEVVCRVFADRHDLDLGHIVTTPHERDKIAAWYGDGVARRVFEGALVIRCKP